MDCGTINKKLSAYLDGELQPAETAEVREHIAVCPECGQALKELKKTSARIRGLEDVDPPAWLEQHVMAKIREEAGQKQGLLQKLFLPLRVKVPFQAAATLALCAAAFLVYKAVEPEIEQPRLLEKEPGISEQADEEIPESGTYGYIEKKEAPSSPDKSDTVRRQLREDRDMRALDMGSLAKKRGSESATGLSGIAPAGKEEIFSSRHEAVIMDKAPESFIAEVVRHGSPPADDTIIEVLFERPDTGELFCGRFPSTHALSRFISEFPDNTLPQLEITTGPPYQGNCLLYDRSRKVLTWKSNETDRPQNAGTK